MYVVVRSTGDKAGTVVDGRRKKHVKCTQVLVVVVVVVAFSSLARILGECSTIHTLPALFCFCFFEVEISSCTLMPQSVHSSSAS